MHQYIVNHIITKAFQTNLNLKALFPYIHCWSVYVYILYNMYVMYNLPSPPQTCLLVAFWLSLCHISSILQARNESLQIAIKMYVMKDLETGYMETVQ